MTSITWAGPRYLQELGTFLGPENRTQRRCELYRYTQYYILFVLPDTRGVLLCQQQGRGCQLQEDGEGEEADQEVPLPVPVLLQRQRVAHLLHRGQHVRHVD